MMSLCSSHFLKFSQQACLKLLLSFDFRVKAMFFLICSIPVPLYEVLTKTLGAEYPSLTFP